MAKLDGEIANLLASKSDLIGGFITTWASFPPLPPLGATITDIRVDTPEGTDYVDVIIETTNYVSVVEGGPIHKQKDFEFTASPSTASVVNVGPGLWAVAVHRGDPGTGVAVLQCIPK
jgi:hypothetical protein